VTPPEGEQEPLNRAWPAVPESIAAARSAVAQYASVAGASADVLDAIRVAVSEAFTNAVLHAYPDADQVGTVDVTAEHTDGVLLIAVAATAHRADDPRLPRRAPRGGRHYRMDALCALESRFVDSEAVAADRVAHGAVRAAA